MKNTSIIIATVCMLCVGLFSTCNKKESMDEGARVAVRLKDAPGDWDKVDIEVLGVKVQTDRGDWIRIPVQGRIIDILRLRDSSTLLGVGTVPISNLTHIKLELGSNHSVTIGGIKFSIAMLIEDERLLDVAVNQSLSASGTNVIVLDLDAAQSLFNFDNNGHHNWHLKPHIKCSHHHNEGDDDRDDNSGHGGHGDDDDDRG